MSESSKTAVTEPRLNPTGCLMSFFYSTSASLCRSLSADHAVMFDPSGCKSCRFILTKQQVLVTRGANTVMCIQGISVISKEKNLHQPALKPVGQENRGVFLIYIYQYLMYSDFPCCFINIQHFSDSWFLALEESEKPYTPLPLTLTAVRWRSHKPSAHTSAVHY